MDHPSASSLHNGDDYLSSLPTECLHLILLQLEDQMFTLRNMLLVSKQFFRLVVPILYKSPFTLIDATKEANLPKTPRVAHLLGTLLGSVAHQRFFMDALPPLGQAFTRFRLSNRDILALTLSNNNNNNNYNKNNNNNNAYTIDPDVQYAIDALDTMGAVQLTTDYLQFYTYQSRITISYAFPTLFPSLNCHRASSFLVDNDTVVTGTSTLFTISCRGPRLLGDSGTIVIDLVKNQTMFLLRSPPSIWEEEEASLVDHMYG
ncbi:MAG: hypothetical protein BYD32DRAFT_460586 [Podila humilis]|nr:MAG: hypothetical protein BYD32DRAFT_460586 [Podila humilis]